MADEAVLLNRDGDIHYFTCADGTAITKGAFMVLSSDPRTVIAHSAAGQVCVGVAVEDKVANDGQVKIGVRTRGIIDAVSIGSVTLGDLVQLSATANRIQALPNPTFSTATLNSVVGRCLETAGAAEAVNILLMCG